VKELNLEDPIRTLGPEGGVLPNWIKLSIASFIRFDFIDEKSPHKRWSIETTQIFNETSGICEESRNNYRTLLRLLGWLAGKFSA